LRAALYESSAAAKTQTTKAPQRAIEDRATLEAIGWRMRCSKRGTKAQK